MIRSRCSSLALGILAAIAAAGAFVRAGQSPATDADRERFLRDARVVRSRPVGVGVTNSVRATMSDGVATHDAHIQTVNDYRQHMRTARGTEREFRDDWRFNLAAYKLDRLLDLQLVPVTVERRWRGDLGAFTWWVDDVMFDEGGRLAKQMRAPDVHCWLQHVQVLRMFDYLIENTDRNNGNTLTTNAWRIWAIDHTRAFRRSNKPHGLDDITGGDRRIVERLHTLDFAGLKREMGSWVSDAQIRALLSRRDALVDHFKKLGDAAMFDRKDPAAGCGGK